MLITASMIITSIKRRMELLLLICLISVSAIRTSTAHNFGLVRDTHNEGGSDLVWQSALESAGHTTTLIDPGSASPDLSKFDFLFVCSWGNSISSNLKSAIESYINGGKSAFIQAEWWSGYDGNNLLVDLIQQQGGSITWHNTISGGLTHPSAEFNTVSPTITEVAHSGDCGVFEASQLTDDRFVPLLTDVRTFWDGEKEVVAALQFNNSSSGDIFTLGDVSPVKNDAILVSKLINYIVSQLPKIDLRSGTHGAGTYGNRHSQLKSVNLRTGQFGVYRINARPTDVGGYFTFESGISGSSLKKNLSNFYVYRQFLSGYPDQFYRRVDKSLATGDLRLFIAKGDTVSFILLPKRKYSRKRTRVKSSRSSGDIYITARSEDTSTIESAGIEVSASALNKRFRHIRPARNYVNKQNRKWSNRLRDYRN